ncbi:MAG: YybH family protein [Gemmatimonadaceae bacterium]
MAGRAVKIEVPWEVRMARPPRSASGRAVGCKAPVSVLAQTSRRGQTPCNHPHVNPNLSRVLTWDEVWFRMTPHLRDGAASGWKRALLILRFAERALSGTMIFSAAACLAAHADVVAKAQVRSALARYDTLIVHMDADRIAASFTPSGETADGDQPPIQGPAAIRSHLRQFAAFQVIANDLDADSIRITGDTAWQTGTYWQRVKIPAGDTVEVHGRFVVIWQQTSSGHWQIRYMHTFRVPAT